MLAKSSRPFSFSDGIQPFSEAKTARVGIHATFGLSKSLNGGITKVSNVFGV
jgi:hypothetical protein